MLFKIEFEIRYTDGASSIVSTRPATDVAFERKFDRTLASLFTEGLPIEAAQALCDGSTDPEHTRTLIAWATTNMRTEWTYFLAWHASRTGEEFDAWLERVDEIDWKLATTVDPSRPAVSAS